MLLYILKSAACLAILLAFYKIFLERENMHTFKRFYLLGSLLAAFAIPFITFVEYVEIPDVTNIIEQSNSNVSVVSSVGQEQLPTNYLPSILWSIYGIGIVVFGFNFIKNLFQIIQRIQKNPKYKVNKITNVLLLDRIIPHTFFNYIFLNKHKFEAKEIPSEVLLHEETHAKQKHSLDVLYIELLQVLFWFNPLLYFMKKAIKLNHEFLADREVIDHGIKPSLYQSILLEFSSSSLQPQLANSINYSSIKKRFTVMKKETSKKSLLLRSLLLITLVSTLVYGFSQKKVIEKYPESPQTIIGTWIDEEQESTELAIFEQNGELVFDWGNSSPIRVQILNGEYYYFSPNSRSKLPNWKDKLPVYFDSEKGTLTYAERKYIPIEKSNKGKLYGNWENKKEGINFNVHHSGNEIVWDVIKADGKPVRYYPKKQGDRYAFTYGKELELLSFKTENGILYDSQGQSYNRVQELQSEEILVKINSNGQLLVQEKNLVALEDLKGFLLKFNTDLTKEQRSNIVRAVIMADTNAPMRVLKDIEAVLVDYGVAQINIIGPEKHSSSNQEIRIQKGATKEQISEYNALAKKYNKMSKDNFRVIGEDVSKLEYIYSMMSDKQRKKAEPFPNFPPPPPAPKAVKGAASTISPRPPSAPKGIQGERSTIAPKATKVNKGEKSNIPPPPSPPDLNEVANADKIIEEIIANQDPYDGLMINRTRTKASYVPNPEKNASVFNYRDKSEGSNSIFIGAFNVPRGSVSVTAGGRLLQEGIDYTVNYQLGRVQILDPSFEASNTPINISVENNAVEIEEEIKKQSGKLHPPPPKSPLDHVVDMAKKDALFYYEGKKISSDKAIALLKKNKKINLRTKHKGLKKPIVELSTKPIIIKK